MRKDRPNFRLGVDIGGTFTDLALFNEADGSMAIHKLLTTPHDPAQCVLEGVEALLAGQEAPMARINLLCHGTTLVTNAVIERKGGLTGMLTTAGFRDVLNIGIENRYDLYDLRLVYPAPLTPRHLQFEVPERIRYDGSIEIPLDLEQVRRTVRHLVEDHEIDALAVCLLHSYANPIHEQQIKALCGKEFPDLYISTSSEVLPFMREFERWTTTTMNSYTQPMVHQYLERLESELEALGFGGRFYIMTSSGGTVTTETARRFPVRLLESGPAAGVLMSSYLSKQLGLPNLLSFDMGGTTAKGALVLGTEPMRKYSLEVAQAHDYKPGSGFTINIPVVDMIEIGAGGGSIADLDVRGVIRVGPQSAGADPGPACYGRGGSLPTMTDADLVLGYLDPDYFLGGQMPLDKEAAGRVITEHLGARLKLGLTRLSWGIHQTVNENIAQAFRVHASERGQDYRSFSMIAFGGSGPVHATRIARILHIPQVIFPLGAGVMSAFGLLVSPLAFETLRSSLVGLDDLTEGDFGSRFEPLIDEVSAFLHDAGVSTGDVTIRRRLDMRYRGQGYEIEVVLPDPGGVPTLLSEIPALFTESYERVFATSFITEPLEIINWKVEAVGPLPEMAAGYRLRNATSGGSARKGTRQAFFPQINDYVDCPVYDRYALHPGVKLDGPALIEERESTCVIGMNDRVSVDEGYNLIVDLSREERSA